jgi:prepilin-type N-terminal cleavage/methylation domain-containing protein
MPSSVVHSCRGRCGARRPRGFTTVELIVVIMLLGVMFAIALPRIRVDNSAVDSAARTLNLAVMASQREAVARAHNVLLRFDYEQHTVTAVWDANNSGSADVGEKSRPFLIPEAVRFGRPPGVPTLEVDEQSADESAALVILQRNGAANRNHTIYLTTVRALQGGTHQDARALRIARATGRPTWYAWTGSAWRTGQ